MTYTKIVKAQAQQGLSADQTFEVELECLKRLKNQPNVAQLIDYDQRARKLELKWAGYSYSERDLIRYRSEIKQAKKTNCPRPTHLDDMLLRLTKQQFVDQWECVFEQLEKNNIVHFDLQAKNVCFDHNTFTLIDFGIAVIDANPLSEFLEKRYEQFLEQGGYEEQKESSIKRIIKELDEVGCRWWDLDSRYQ